MSKSNLEQPIQYQIDMEKINEAEERKYKNISYSFVSFMILTMLIFFGKVIYYDNIEKINKAFGVKSDIVKVESETKITDVNSEVINNKI